MAAGTRKIPANGARKKPVTNDMNFSEDSLNHQPAALYLLCVLARFGSQYEAQRVINNRKLISDGIEYQRELFKRLRAEANAHNSANLNSQKTVRFMHGTPSLVDVRKSFGRHNSGNSKN
ncbi:hypothetical protein TSAR_008564 [Trichomalopsis sarcophagae]|uniref:Uncharacterized protein n=1 Tax=Trichomalopsis sarcophagae TaxID=543379 RepID=A0A232EME1_9HYME|nr:hypothetical protein TSAR_008564 [Trichomalopsis sarcophagae]